MIENIIDYSVRNPLVVVFATFVLLVWGVHATINTPVDAIPDLSENQMVVFADWPGRSPQEVEDQVTYPLSVNLQGLAGIKAVRATSEFGFSMVNLIFEDSVDFYFARQRILERLSIAATFLPEGVDPYLAPDANALGQIFWYTVEGEGQDIGRLRAIQDWFVRYQLYSVPGVAEVASVGGFPIEYQIDIDPNKLRGFGVTLGELDSAVARSNSAVGGRVIQKANSEYLVRSMGWIRGLEDIERIVIKSVAGTPIRVGDVATVQRGSAQRRAALEKNGNEAVGGVVLMRFGENPLEVTKGIKKKIEQLQSGLPEGVRIVPFYDRTRLIHNAIETVTEALLQESLVASLAIIVVMWHFRSALIICLVLPLATLISFIMMKLLGISSNIMSLAGIAISIGVLVDAAIVMVDQGAHTLHQHFGYRRVHGDTRELLLPALRSVGRPIFFSLAIMIISFVPVFALGGMEGRMFHPLAYTKTFALVGVSVLAITLVPALIPWLVRGRIRHEQDSWIVRRVIEVYRPVLDFVMRHPWPITWIVGMIYVVGAVPVGVPWIFSLVLLVSVLLTACSTWNEELAFSRHWRWTAGVWIAALAILAGWGLRGGWQPAAVPAWLSSRGFFLWLGMVASGGVAVVLLSWALASIRWLATISLVGSLVLVGLLARGNMQPLGREFMPPLDEGSILDMPVTIPRASITQVADDLKARDAEIRAFPEVELVVGKAGRAETPTDPAPPDMIETVINLRPREHWPKRELRYGDAMKQTDAMIHAMWRRGWLKADSALLDTLANDATMLAMQDFERDVRSQTLREFAAFEQMLAPELTRSVVAHVVELLRKEGKLLRPVSAEVQLDLAQALTPGYGAALVSSPNTGLLGSLAQNLVKQLADKKHVVPSPSLLVLRPGRAEEFVRSAAEVLGVTRPTYQDLLLEQLLAERDLRWKRFVKELNWRMQDRGASLYTSLVAHHLREKAAAGGLMVRQPEESQWRDLQHDAHAELAGAIMLWRKSKDGLLKEMDSATRMPGWGNIWTQPIINRVDMLATGVRTMLGVKIYGDDLYEIQDTAAEVAGVLRGIPGAVDVFPDQIVGEGYLEINIDRERAARYGVNVGDIQDVVETALGGKVITTTVEGRERFPVRIRYARAFREDEESVKDLLISAERSAGPTETEPDAANESTASDSPPRPLQIPLSQVADVRVVQGPSMIKSENGLLRAYVQLNVRDRDIVGFVEEARQAVAGRVKLPAGMYLEWSGQFEHQLRARRTLTVVVPLVLLTIFVILYITYHDLADTVIVLLLAVPGAIFGGVLFQYFFGHNFSVAVWVGYIACFGLATEGGLVILVYLREAIETHGGLENMSLDEVRHAIMDGAVHRTRPKLLTELTTMIGLAPLLWASGTGSEVIQPMAAPVLGGILVSDEVIDLLLPVFFYHVRVWRWRKLHRAAASLADTDTGHRGGQKEAF